ncbi:hypothetical protein [Micromonospora sp. RP3T]|uniref:hypothetical protein n=1 Tax=Micromonospora sp. RP3T TaxID=2135446 RepID=UPI000D1588E8|nr:hypothetical protein [Micromonospora sp. RP3T]PTA47816.1 hypothetical protein C8054_02905 [Micromonospora sp. RP3T]
MSPRHTPPHARPESTADATGWITGVTPDGWFSEPPQVVIDRDEITIWGRLPEPQLAADATDADRAAAQAGRILRFREDTRDDRIRVARQVEHRYQRKVSWGVRCGATEQLFSHLAAPVMTRLRQPERQILDTLVDAGVARSRSEALAWCVRLVGRHTDDWLTQLRQAMTTVDDLRRQGPDGV